MTDTINQLKEFMEGQPFEAKPKSEIHAQFETILTDAHTLINGQLDALQKTIDSIRLMIKDRTEETKSAIGKHFEAAETALKLIDGVKQGLSEIETMVNEK